MDFADINCELCGKPANHWHNYPDETGERGDHNFCCFHHVARGSAPADWHPDCMKAWEDLKASTTK